MFYMWQIQSSNEGDVVLDLFCGSGVTCEVAKEFNRNYIGCDLTDKSIEICKNKGLLISKL